MRILFICKANVGRSQMAKAFFNQYSQKHIADGAGTNAIQYEHMKLSEFADQVVTCMREIGIDISNEVSKQITPEMVNSADRIIAIVDRKEWPDYLINSNKVTFWDIPDGANKDHAFHVQIRNEIENRVKELVREIG